METSTIPIAASMPFAELMETRSAANTTASVANALIVEPLCSVACVVDTPNMLGISAMTAPPACIFNSESERSLSSPETNCSKPVAAETSTSEKLRRSRFPEDCREKSLPVADTASAPTSILCDSRRKPADSISTDVDSTKA